MEPTMYYRGNIDELPAVPQPFYAYGTGISLLRRNEPMVKKGGVNPFVELLWGVEGIGELVLYGQAFQIKPGDVFYYLPGETHESRPLGAGWNLRWVCFDGPLAEAVMLSYRYPRHQRPEIPYPKWLFEDLERNIGNSDPLQIRRMAAVILELLACAGSRAAGGLHSESLTRRCAEFIAANLTDPQLGVGTLCDEFSLARSTLTKIFSEQMGCAPGRYIMNHRMAHATALLRGTSLPVGEVAKRCGFAETRSFSRFIRRCHGVSPLELRKQGGSGKPQESPAGQNSPSRMD